ncbi:MULTISPECIES: TnsA endonuclease C-terminal domain-containing protein [Bacillaceae]|uniref:Heteromeric transposase endonuclease subunit TnsA n=1 Tax=Psychrobacillus lasiicapitis TaxID=1636719 RepID=A0A544SSA9_9BACI|nr:MULTISPECIES: TnsA endonuclease C-terminal domain-containing protein [Bacillaceae]MCZ8542255.1 TnsA endonuclease N-terminal domain-containing protein [Psychrobacillus psychrodurans]TQR08005.1 heteromeric transposase endonuclease subunit TnsA [Psychrobacillus lasiicapitis]GGA49932.1 transposase [Psychrobacillus lasiicapitis]SFN23593.1 TnsA endonuclease C terminal [Psychrobacillus psychrodurans]
MAKRKRSNSTETKIEKWIKEGRGQGEGAGYKPWLEIQDVASNGYATRNLGWKTLRKHHFLSDFELHYFYTLEWSSYVLDIREQYPLLPLKRTVEIAERIGVEHPRENGSTGPLKVITTDFYLIVQTQTGQKTVVRSVKPIDKLTVRELEKFDIEKIFFEEIGITDWGIVTETDIPKIFIKNIGWFYDAKTLDNRPNINLALINRLEPRLYKAIKTEEMGLSNLALKYDEIFGLEYGSCLFIIKYLLANKTWQTDIMNKLINPSERIEIFDKQMNDKSVGMGGVS